MHEEKIRGRTVTFRVLELTNKIQNLTEQFLLARKTEEKIRRLQSKAWFKVIDYHAEEKEIKRVKNF